MSKWLKWLGWKFVQLAVLLFLLTVILGFEENWARAEGLGSLRAAGGRSRRAASIFKISRRRPCQIRRISR